MGNRYNGKAEGMGGGFYSTEEGLLAPHTAQRRKDMSMRAWDLLYTLGDGFVRALPKGGVPQLMVSQWWDVWVMTVLDPCSNGERPEDLVAPVMQGLTMARELVRIYGDD